MKALVVTLSIITAVFGFLFVSKVATVYKKPTSLSIGDQLPEWLKNGTVEIPDGIGIQALTFQEGGALVLKGVQTTQTQTIDLCTQLANPQQDSSQMLPLHVGLSWNQLYEVIQSNRSQGLPAHANIRSPLLDGGDSKTDIPDFSLSTYPYQEPVSAFSRTEGEMGLYFKTPKNSVAWISDMQPQILRAPSVTRFRQKGWLLWSSSDQQGQWDKALEVTRNSFVKSRCGESVSRQTNHSDLGSIQFRYLQVDKQARLKKDDGLVTTYFLPDQPSTYSIKRLRLRPGAHQTSLPRIEDETLFNRLVEAGLVTYGREGIQLVSKDAPIEAALMGGPWPEEQRELHSTLYYKAPGLYVRKMVKRWNEQSRASGIRLQATNAVAQSTFQSAKPWEVTVDGERVELTNKAPLKASRLFKAMPKGWQGWNFVKSTGELGNLDWHLKFTTPARGVEDFTVLAIGDRVEIEGAKVISQEIRCFEETCDANNRIALYLNLRLVKGANELKITTEPLETSKSIILHELEYQPIQVVQGQLRWKTLPSTSTEDYQSIPVSITDAQGEPLWDSFKTTNDLLGLEQLLGLDPRHRNSVGGILSELNRRSTEHYSSVNAKITIDMNMQRMVQQRLNSYFDHNPNRLNAKFGKVLILDADNGDILASASTQNEYRGLPWEDLAGYQARNNLDAPLSYSMWQHDGLSYNAPGSTFKLVTGLMLEQQAKQDTVLLKTLKGLTQKQLGEAQQDGYGFSAYKGCYPIKSGSCDNHSISNYGDKKLYFVDERYTYGLAEAIRVSTNTWFAWQQEKTDLTLLESGEAGVPHVRAMLEGALATQRPIMATMHQLGMTQRQQLDGGLLATVDFSNADLFSVSPTTVDPLDSKLAIRQLGIGLRVQTTPLHMAQISASIATGRVVKGRLLKELNGKVSHSEEDFGELDIELDRIREGMKAVPATGTAKGSFAKHPLLSTLYMKTGTAPITSGSPALNSAWLTGWMGEPTSQSWNPVKLIRSDKGGRIAFVCQFAYTARTGGAACGPLMADILSEITKLRTKPDA